MAEQPTPSRSGAEVTGYSSAYCGYCGAAKRLLSEKGVPFTEIDVTHDAALRAWMVEDSGGRRTVPQIFIDREPIGGYTDLAELDRSGRLDALLEETGSK